jgi:sugar lactone lactonase YvrE
MRGLITVGSLGTFLGLSALGLGQALGQANSGAIPPADAAEVKHEIRLVEALTPKVPDRGAVLFLLAQDYAHLGDLDKALSLLRECVALDEGFDPEGDAAFGSLAANAGFRKLIEEVHQRYPTVQRGKVALTVAEKEFFPEGLAADQAGALYMGSMNLRKIVKIESDGHISDFVRAGRYDLSPICGLKVDPAGEGLWANTCSDDGVGAQLLHFSRAGELMERFTPPASGQHLFNDLVLRGAKEIYLTDSLANRAYRFDRRSHTFSELRTSRPIYYPNGIALSEDGNLLYIADAFGILQLNLRENLCREVIPGPSNTVSGADGLYWYRNSLIAIQNSFGTPRVAQFHLSRDGVRVTKTAVLEYRSPLITLPTTGAIVGPLFYFMSNTGLDNFKSGKIVDRTRLEPVRIAVLELEH